MCRLDCIIAQSKKQSVLSALHRGGNTQIEPIGDDELKHMKLNRDSPKQVSESISESILLARYMIEKLAPFGQEEGSFLDEILGVEDITPIKVSGHSVLNLIHEFRDYAKRYEAKIRELEGTISEKASYFEKIDARLRQIEPLSHMDIPLNWIGEGDGIFSALSVLDADFLGEIEQALEDELGQEHAISTIPSKEGAIVIVSCMAERRADMEDALRKTQFEPYKVPEGDESFKKHHSLLTVQARDLADEIAQADAGMKRLHERIYRKLKNYEEMLLIEAERANVFGSFAATNSTCIFRLWVPYDRLDETMELINAKSGKLCIISVEEDPEDAPVMLDNPEILKPFETFTNLYSPPQYGRIDPTIVTAPTFVLFFGFMLGDAFYGAMMYVMAYLLSKKYARHSNVTDFMTVLKWLGASTFVFGILTGSFFGNFVSFYIYGLETSEELGRWVLIDPMYKNNAILLLIMAAAVGALHNIAGNALGFADLAYAGKMRQAVTDNGGWLVIWVGIISGYVLEPWIGASIFAIGFALLLAGKGPLALLDVPGLLGNVMSYARLLALNLTTPGMALAFNLLASMLWSVPTVGPFLAGALFIVSHIIILLLNSLGSFVHTMRLHYVEYYGTFYEGGGVAFVPFKENRRYTVRR